MMSIVNEHMGFRVDDRVFVFGMNPDEGRVHTIVGIDTAYVNPFHVKHYTETHPTTWLLREHFRSATAEDDQQAARVELERIDSSLERLTKRRMEVLALLEDT